MNVERLVEQPLIQILIGAVAVCLAIVLFDQVFKQMLESAIRRLSKRENSWIYEFFRDEKLIFWILSLPYLTIIDWGVHWIPDLPEKFHIGVDRIAYSLYVVVGLIIVSHVFRVTNTIYSRFEISKQRPLKGYLQGIQIILFMVGFICVLAILLDKSPLIFLSGLGAMTAILLLVFKDTILSFVAGVQLTANDLIRVGDWVEMDQFDADGEVVEIALNTVMIQNWDQTITVIPTHQFLENSFKNWRGMQISGGRRIKRSILIDLNTIRFLNESDLERLSRIRILRDYLTKKIEEIRSFNCSEAEFRVGSELNYRRLTNIGTFRAYISEYLKSNKGIHKGMTFLVRQLAPTENGVPLEIYVFANDTRWAIYEGIQSDIFDHIFATLPEFGLRAFQNFSGTDLGNLGLKSSRPAAPNGTAMKTIDQN